MDAGEPEAEELEALRQAEHHFRVAFDRAPTGNAILTTDGRFLRVNARLGTLLDVNTGVLVGRSFVDFVRDQDRAALTAFFRHVMAVSHQPHTHEMRLLQTTGRTVHVALSATAVSGPVGEPDHLVIHVEDVTARKLAQAALAHHATHDALTALPNRTLLLDRLGTALDRAPNPSTVAVLFCDIDRFKRINDSLGHETGDLVLVELARRLRRVVPPHAIVGRAGGDEFLVILPEVADPAQASELAQRVRGATVDPVVIGGQALQVGLSIGVALASEADQPATLIHRADTAMYQAKEQGRDRIEVFHEQLIDRARHRLATESALRKAIAERQLRLHHQPIVDLTDGSVVGSEALLRWADPDRGLVSPGEFLDVAEESDLIVEVGSWVVQEACRQGALLRQHSSHSVSVNVSARQLRRSDFRAVVEAALEAAGLAAHDLVIELTETTLLEASPATVADLEGLSTEGVRLAVDDFGTGYSSLTYLQKLPVDVVKIDRSFVAGLTSDRRHRSITQAVVALGRALDLRVVAEGVETAAQAAALRDMGCSHAQGYHFGHPAPLDIHLDNLSRPA